MKKWMVWDTATDDKVFHDTEDEAREDYSEAIAMVEGLDDGRYSVYLFEVKEQEDIVI